MSTGTVDKKIKEGLANGMWREEVADHTRDACDRSCNVTFTSTTEGNIIIKPGETKYFARKKIDSYTRSGGYYWKCCNTNERSRLNENCDYIKVVRKTDTGAFDQYGVFIKPGDLP